LNIKRREQSFIDLIEGDSESKETSKWYINEWIMMNGMSDQ
jgi:hypothetical protein